MAMGMNFPKKPDFALSLALPEGHGMAKLVDTFMELLAKEKKLNFGGMGAKLKLKSIKGKEGNLHELKLKPSTEQQKKIYGKNVSSFFGVIGNSLVATHGKSAKANARKLSKSKGKLASKGSKLSAAIDIAKTKSESLVVAMDMLSLRGSREPNDVTPVVVGLGFTPDTIRMRIFVPTDFVKEAAASVSN
jgi:hypothetical protein